MSATLFIDLMQQINEAITAATVIVAASLLMYNLTRGLNDRVTRASAALLGCVTIIYIGDVMVYLSLLPGSIEIWLRMQWIGIAFAPTTLFHLSDALLATTGLISRGRRRRVVRILYFYSITFLVAAAFTDLIVGDLVVRPIEMMTPGLLFPVFVAFFVLALLFAFNNVVRARRRCLTAATRRRMTYLLLALITPAIGIFPFSLLFSSQPAEASSTSSGLFWLLINAGNIGIILMLAFMAYPLAFFGPSKPDRVIKAELLSFMLRGPVLAIAVLMVILFLPRLQSSVFPATQLMPFVAVAVVLFLQWSYVYLIPILERRLIYTRDQAEAKQIRTLSERLLTTADAHQLLEAILASICDYLRVASAFVVSRNADGLHMEQQIGSLQPAMAALEGVDFKTMFNLLPSGKTANGHDEPQPLGTAVPMVSWQSYWLVPLFSKRNNGHYGQLIGVIGLWARSTQPDLLEEEAAVFELLYNRATRIVDDMQLQEEVFDELEDVIQATNQVQEATDSLRRGYASGITQLTQSVSSANTAITASPDFVNVVKDALRDYWGGPRLTDERLLGLYVVKSALKDNENNPAKAVRTVLSKAIERLKPDGARNLTTTEWTLYNILDMRFIQGRKVRDVIQQLAMSEADLYRKQKTAIERVAEVIADMETHIASPAV
jgi:hypothetical protein